MRAALAGFDGLRFRLRAFEQLRGDGLSTTDAGKRSFGRTSCKTSFANCYKLTIDIFQASYDGTSNSLLDWLLYKACSERFESLVQEVVLGVTNRKLECVDLHIHVLDLEDRQFVFIRRDEVDSRLFHIRFTPIKQVQPEHTVMPSPPSTSAMPESTIFGMPVFFLK